MAGPSWLRPAAGGILLGLLLLAVPQMYGVGYPVLQHAVAGHYVILALLGLLVAKILATSLTMWIGGSGGVFAPSLFMGAMLGIGLRHRRAPPAARAGRGRGRLRPGRDGRRVRRHRPGADHRTDHHLRAHRQLPHHPAADVRDRGRHRAQQPRSPRTPSTPSSSAAAGSISTRPAPRAEWRRSPSPTRWGEPREPLKPDQPLPEIVERFAAERTDSLPVINAVGSLIGVIAASDVERAISHGTDGAPFARDVPRLQASDSLEDAVHALASTDDEGLPVTDDNDQLIGWITHRRVLRAYLNRFGAPQDTARTQAPPPAPTAPSTGPLTPAHGPRR